MRGMSIENKSIKTLRGPRVRKAKEKEFSSISKRKPMRIKTKTSRLYSRTSLREMLVGKRAASDVSSNFYH